ncbi:MAG: pyrroline-5-carboxylate reductase [Proteobacteria bacterium]|nr:pyrroline-5-carboxylate reductase [Pseudomonadota bacterium]MBU1649822.1 pyrroline-5-carboxylate reductase [Pseudomonadota bacterium]
MTTKIGFIGGGQMGEALIRGIIQSGLYAAEDILIAEPDGARRNYLNETYQVQPFDTGVPIWKSCATVILAVKPQVMGSLLTASKELITTEHLIISIAAGLPISFYESHLSDRQCKIIRVMPNTPALVLESASALSGNINVTPKEMDFAKSLFDAVGVAIILNEQYLDAVTGLSGSGPAYVFTFIEGMIDAGIKTGLARPIAETLAIQTVLGSVKLMQESGKHPAVLRAMVTSPGGTTIAAQHVMEKAGFKGIIMDAIEAATNRSIELGKK